MEAGHGGGGLCPQGPEFGEGGRGPATGVRGEGGGGSRCHAPAPAPAGGMPSWPLRRTRPCASLAGKGPSPAASQPMGTGFGPRYRRHSPAGYDRAVTTEPRTAMMPRTRSVVPQWSRLLWLGALLVGLLYAHGLHADSSVGHTAPGSVAGLATGHLHEGLSGVGDTGDPDGESSAAIQDCATGQPATGFDVPPPAVSPLVAEPALAGTAHAGSPAAAWPAADRGSTSAVLRI